MGRSDHANESFFGSADRSDLAAGRARSVGRRSLPKARDCRADVLPVEEEVFSELQRNLVTMICGAWKIVYEIDTGTTELYNLIDDPIEKTDIDGFELEKTDELKKRLLSWIENKKSNKIEETKAKLNQNTLKQLEALGNIN
jgi:hypothetical protein